MDIEDLFQEALLVFIRVHSKYVGVEPKHLMSLYQVSLINKVHGLSSKFVPFLSEEEAGLFGLEDKSQKDELDLVTTLLSAPQEVVDLLQEIFQEDSELLLKGRISNRRVCRFFGLDKKTRPADALRNLLKTGYRVTGRQVSTKSHQTLIEDIPMKPFQLLCKAVDYTPDPSGDLQQVLYPLVEAVNDMEEDDFTKLPQNCKNWFNKSVECVDKDTEIPAPAGYKDWHTANVAGTEHDTEPDETDKKEKVDKTPNMTAAKKKAKEKSAVKTAAKAATTKATKKKQTEKKEAQDTKDKIHGKRGTKSAVRTAQMHILGHKNYYDVSVESIVKHVRGEDLTVAANTANNTLRRIKSVVECMLEAGWMDEKQAKKFVQAPE